jgi:hypothetical protein
VSAQAVTLEVFEKGKKAPNWNLDSDINGELTHKDLLGVLQGTIVSTIKAAVREEQAKGFDKNPRYFVDGTTRKPLELVNPFGTVDVVAKVGISDMVLGIYNFIVLKSPITTGYYSRQNIVLVNNKNVAENEEQLKNFLKTAEFKHSDTIRFVNIAPYARKLERHGVSRGRKKPKVNKRHGKRLGEVNVPNGVYVLAERAAQRKYGKNAYIKFNFIVGGESGLSGLTGNNRTYKTNSGIESRLGKPYFYPSILVRVISEAITGGSKL